MSIRFKVLTSMLVAFLTVILFLGGFMYTRFEEVITERVKRDVKGVMLENKQSFNNVVRGIGRGFASVSQNDFIVEKLLKHSESPAEISKNKVQFMNEYRSIFELSVGSMLNKYALHFYVNKELPAAKTLDNVKLKTFSNTNYGVYSTVNQENETWYKDTLKSDAPWHIFRIEENENYVYFYII